jgi:hypothetical protein
MNERNAFAGFRWEIASNPLGIPDSDRWCVRQALCQLMGWPRGSAEWRSIPPGPPATDLKRLSEEMPKLRLTFHRLDERVPGTTKGIVIGEIEAAPGIVGHAAYAPQIGTVADSFRGIMGVITRD